MSAIVSIVSCVPQAMWETFLCFPTRKAGRCGHQICFGQGTVSDSDIGGFQAEASRGPSVLPSPSVMKPAGTSCFFSPCPEIHLKLTHKNMWRAQCKYEAGEIAPWITHSLHKYEGWSPDLQHPHKCWVGKGSCLLLLAFGGSVRGIPGDS